MTAECSRVSSFRSQMDLNPPQQSDQITANVFRKVERSYHSTPDGWRLATYKEAKDGLETIKKKSVLRRWDRARLLDGWITGAGYDYEMGDDFKGCLGYMLLIHIQTQASSCAYGDVQLGKRGKEVALFLCVDDWNYEVVYWLLNSWSNSEIMNVGEVRGGNIPLSDVEKFEKMNKMIGHLARRLEEEGGAAIDKAKMAKYSNRQNSVKEIISSLMKVVKEEKGNLHMTDQVIRRYIQPATYKYSLPDSLKTEDIPDSFFSFVCDNFPGYVVEVCSCLSVVDIRQMKIKGTSQSNLMIATSILLHLSHFRRSILHEPLEHNCDGSCATKMLSQAKEKAAGNPGIFYEMLRNNALWNNYDDILDKLLFVVAKPKHNDIEGRDKIAVVDMLLKCGARPRRNYAIGKYRNKTVLHSVAKYQEEDVGIEVAQALLDKCDEETIYKFVKDADERRRTALHSASQKGNARIAELLLDHGASVFAKDLKDMTALHCAFERETDTLVGVGAEIVKVLLARCDNENIGDFVNATDESGRTALHRASEKGSTHICELLADHGCSVSAQDKESMTALHYAFEGAIDRAIGVGTEIAKVLLRMCDKQNIRVFVNAKDRGGRTALHRASEKGNSRICELLVEQGASVIAQDEEGMTALHYAFEGEVDRVIGMGTEIAKVLLRMCDKQNIRMFVNAVDIHGRTALHGASEKGNAYICGLLIDSGSSVTVQDKEGMTALHYAFEGGFHKVTNAGKQILEAFLRRSGRVFEELSMRVCINAADKRGITVLQVASEKADSHICGRLLASGASVTARDKSGQTALHYAFNGEIDRVIDVGIPIAEALLSRFNGQSDPSIREFVNAADESARTALHRASENANALICAKLADLGASVTAQDKKGMTALHYAFEGGIDKDRDVASEIAEALVRRCDEHSMKQFVNATDEKGRTALHYASQNGTAHACELLAEEGAVMTAQDSEGRTALHCAFDGRSDRDAGSAIAKALLTKCDEQTIREFVNATDKRARSTALHVASLKGPAHICRLLVDRGAELTARDKNSWTALHYALEVGVDKDIDTGTEIAKALLDKCEERNTYEFVNAADDRGWTALHGASEKGIAHLCELLLDRGASVTAQDTKGRTALHCAVKRRMGEVIDVLLKSSRVNFSLALRDDDGCTPVDVALANTDYVTTAKLLVKSEQSEAYLDRTLPNIDDESTAKLLSKCKNPEAYFSKVNQEHLLRNSLLLGSVDIVYMLLEKGIKLSDGDYDEDGKSAFHLAATCDNESNAIEMSASIIGRVTPENVEKMVAVCDREGRTALHAAALNGYKELCIGLLGFNSELIYIKDSKGRNPLFDAVKGEYKGRALYKKLLDAYLKKEIPHDDLVDRTRSLTPLHVAASKGKAQAVKVLLSWDKIKDEYLTKGDNIAQTALHKAVKRGYIDIVEILLKHGAHPLRERDRDGRTALHYVVQAKTQSKQKLAPEDKKELANKLLKACKSDKEKALLLWASAAGLGTADQYLDPGHLPDAVHKHLEAERKRFQKENLLQIAVSHENIEMTKELISRGYQIERIRDPARGAQLREANNETVNRVLRQVKMIKEQGNDKPTISDSLGRLNYAQGLAALFLNPCIKPPIAVGITGSWGTGKSSLMLQTERILLTTASQMALLPSSKLSSSASELPGIKKCELSVIGKRKCEYIYRQIKRGERVNKNVFVTLWDYIRGKVKQTSAVEIEKKMETFLNECEEKFINQNDLKYLTVFKALAAMDSSDMSAPKVDSSAGENSSCLHWPSSPKTDTSAEENMHGVLTVQYNAWRYRNDTEALAGLAVEITKELEGIMSQAQWLNTCWRNAWIKNKYSLWIEFFFPPLLALVLAGSLTWIAWVVFGSEKLKEWGSVKYAWPPAAFVTIVWTLTRSAMGILKPVSSQLMQYMTFPDHSDKLGYQERVISDICFLKEEIGKTPFWVFNDIAWLLTAFTALWDLTSFLFYHRSHHDNAIQAPKLTPSSGSNLRIIVFVDDLDRCSESVILQVLAAVNLVLAVCEINVVIGMDKKLIQSAIIKKYEYVNIDKSLKTHEELADVYLQKIIQLPLDLPDPRDDESRNFLRGQLGVMDNENTAVTRGNGGRERESVELENTANEQVAINMQPSVELAHMRLAASGKEKPTLSILVREMLFVRYYSKGEEDAFLYFHELATDYRKHPREWKRLLNYHRLVWYIFSASKEANNLVGWQVQLITWIFICWEWQDNMTVVIKNWKEIGDIKLESPPSLLRIVEHLMNTGGTAYQDSENANSGKLANDELNKSLDELKTEIKKLKETVSDDLMKQIADLKKRVFGELKEDMKKGKEQIVKTEGRTNKEKWHKKNWHRMKSTLEKYDVSMDGIQAFQRFRFYCIAGYLPWLGKDTEDGDN